MAYKIKYTAASAQRCREVLTDLSKKGYQFLKENKNSDARACFAKILESDKGNNYALVGMGDASRKMTDYADAVHYYERCLEHHPGNNYALFGLADCYKALGQFQRAIDIWTRYLQYDGENITVLTRIADAYRKLHDFRNSKQMYQRVLEMEQNNTYAIIGLGHLHYDFKEYRDALFYWEKMIERSGMMRVDIRVLTSIGNCYRKLKTFDEGITYFDAALRRESSNFYALFGLGDCYRGLNQPYRALDYWNILLTKEPSNKVILTRAGDAYSALQEYEKAAEYYHRALAIEHDTYAILGLSIIAKVHGRFDDAIAMLNELIQADTKNPRPYLELSDCYEKTGGREAAISTLHDFLRFGIRSAAVSERLERLSE